MKRIMCCPINPEESHTTKPDKSTPRHVKQKLEQVMYQVRLRL